MQNNPLPHSRWRHYKSSWWDDYTYEVLGIAVHSETQEEMVLYKTLYDADGSDGRVPFPKGTLVVRPLALWYNIVEYEGKKVQRFTPID